MTKQAKLDDVRSELGSVRARIKNAITARDNGMEGVLAPLSEVIDKLCLERQKVEEAYIASFEERIKPLNDLEERLFNEVVKLHSEVGYENFWDKMNGTKS